MKKILVEQRADRADVDDVARERVIKRISGKDVDLGVVAATHHLKLTGMRNFACESDTARTHDAAIGVELDQVGDVLAGVDRPLLDEPVGGLAVFIAVVVQPALAGLVADGAIERMVDQE